MPRNRWEILVKTFVLSCLLIVATAVSALAAQITVINSSDYVIHHFHVSPSKSRSWGPDQLGKAIIGRAERFTVRNIPEGTYDLKLVDEDEDECIVENVDVSGDMTWTLTDTVIENCVK
jgi:hypothetical protein